MFEIHCRQTNNLVKSHGNPTGDYITLPIAPYPRTIKNQTIHKPNFNIEGGFVTFPIAPPPGATYPNAPNLPKAKSKGSPKRRKTKKPANNFPSNSTRDGVVEESSKMQKNKRKGHKRHRTKARAHQDSALQRDAPVKSNTAKPHHQPTTGLSVSNRQPNFPYHLNAGIFLLFPNTPSQQWTQKWSDMVLQGTLKLNPNEEKPQNNQVLEKFFVEFSKKVWLALKVRRGN